MFSDVSLAVAVSTEPDGANFTGCWNLEPHPPLACGFRGDGTSGLTRLVETEGTL